MIINNELGQLKYSHITDLVNSLNENIDLDVKDIKNAYESRYLFYNPDCEYDENTENTENCYSGGYCELNPYCDINQRVTSDNKCETCEISDGRGQLKKRGIFPWWRRNVM